MVRLCKVIALCQEQSCLTCIRTSGERLFKGIHKGPFIRAVQRCHLPPAWAAKVHTWFGLYTYEFPPYEFLLTSWGPTCDHEGTPGTSGSTDTKFSTVGVVARGHPVMGFIGSASSWHVLPMAHGAPGVSSILRGSRKQAQRSPSSPTHSPKAGGQESIESRPPARPLAGPTSATARGGRSPRPKSSPSLEEQLGGSQNLGVAAAWPGRQRNCVLTDQPDSEHQLGIHCHNCSHLPPATPAPHCRSHPSSWPRPYTSPVPSGRVRQAP